MDVASGGWSPSPWNLSDWGPPRAIGSCCHQRYRSHVLESSLTRERSTGAEGCKSRARPTGSGYAPVLRASEELFEGSRKHVDPLVLDRAFNPVKKGRGPWQKTSATCAARS